MKLKFSLNIAEISCVITCEKYGIFQRLKTHFEGFCDSNLRKDVIYLNISQTKKKLTRDKSAHCSNATSLYYSNVGLKGECFFDMRVKTGCIFLNSGGKKMVNFIHFSLREIYKFILPFYNGIAIHASSVMFKDKGILFIGSSGDGKSTVVKVLPPAYTILHDDLALLRQDGGANYCLYSAPLRPPFYQGLNCNVKVRAENIFSLRKNRFNNTINPAPMQMALKKLIQNAHGLGIGYPHPNRNEIFKNCCGIAKTIPSFILGFSKNKTLYLDRICTHGA
ncbi:MAG: hypothetical protein AUJ70_04570 [Candidatus Omnitrophica bacterium CG1_02_40_15]|nr:MAG: hypothetical protein AUJ70_04570 [Candidatus Omnitrophica bacterium CG1_02_40_15]